MKKLILVMLCSLTACVTDIPKPSILTPVSCSSIAFTCGDDPKKPPPDALQDKAADYLLEYKALVKSCRQVVTRSAECTKAQQDYIQKLNENKSGENK